MKKYYEKLYEQRLEQESRRVVPNCVSGWCEVALPSESQGSLGNGRPNTKMIKDVLISDFPGTQLLGGISGFKVEKNSWKKLSSMSAEEILEATCKQNHAYSCLHNLSPAPGRQ